VCDLKTVSYRFEPHGVPKAANSLGNKKMAFAARRSYAVSATFCVESPKMKP
jgi:hypothetical protein